MRKAVFVLVLGVVALASVLVARTVRFTSKQIPVEPARTALVDRTRVAAHLAEAIRLKTISFEHDSEAVPAEFLRLHEALRRSFPRVHATLIRETVNELSLLYTWKGARPELPPFLFMAHQDVVPIEPGTESRWSHPPFEGVEAEGFVWGRGAMDDKGNLVAILEAVETLIEEGFVPERTLYLGFGHDEERGGEKGARRIAELLKSRGVALDYVVDEGGALIEGMLPGLAHPVAMVGLAEKGYLSVELAVEVEGGHSSAPPRSTAVGILSRAIVRLEENPMPGGIRGLFRETLETVGPEMSFLPRMAMANLWLTRGFIERRLASSPATDATLRTTTAATIFEGGVKANVLPAKARAVVNFRVHSEDSVEKVLEHVRRTVDDARVKVAAVAGEAREPSPVSPVASVAYVRLARTIRELFPGAVVSPYLVPGGTDARHYTALTPNVYRFSPLRVTEGDLRRAHGTDERIATENLEQLVRFFIALVRNSQ